MKEFQKYKPTVPVKIENRVWPTQRMCKAPTWVAVDLRDGNQAFVNPMNVEEKIEYFKMLVDIGFKEIEVAYPSASTDEFNFVRRLIEENMIPDDVTISVFTAARQDLINRTIESIKGVKKAIVHCYIATSDLHNNFVLCKTRDEITNIAVSGTRMIKEAVYNAGMKDVIRYEFSPEEFTDSDIDFIVDLTSQVYEEWKPKVKSEFILNLPSTVERRPPYEYADLIEYFTRNYPYMDKTTLSIHAHNDQGCAVAAAEMAVLAGAERVEGTILGHGERSGNMDNMIFALNLQTRGIETGLNFSRLPEIVSFIEKMSEIKTNPRYPYAGDLIFTAFSGTHQDAISKGMAKRKAVNEFFQQGWKMPYLTIDPMDIGANYDQLIRINSQSGKGGIAYVLENFYNVVIPKEEQHKFAAMVQKYAESSGAEVPPSQVYNIFINEYSSQCSDISFSV